IRHVYCNTDEYYLGAVPTGFWAFYRGINTRQHEESTPIRGYRSAPYYYENYKNYPAETFHGPFPYYEVPTKQVFSPHLAVRRSALKSSSITEPDREPTEKKSAIDIDEQKFLKDYYINLDELAYNTAKYVHLSIRIAYEHIRCVGNIIKITFNHIIRKSKLLLQNPVRLLFLPFTMPVDVFRFIVQTSKFVVAFVHYLFF
ncbi:hypothetical protein ILUMI_13410, partial [Ignelater luminosus]